MALTVSVLVFSIFSLSCVVEECMTEDLEPTEDPSLCTPGSVWEFSGRTCVCRSSGLGGPPHTCSSRRRGDDLTGDLCKPGSMWMVNGVPCLCPMSSLTEDAVCYKTTSSSPIWPY